MKVVEVKINGVKAPVGFNLTNIRCSWKVVDTESTDQLVSRIEVLRGFDLVTIWKKEGKLNCNSEEIDFIPAPRSMYFIKITVVGKNGDSAKTMTSFVSGKMDEAWEARWIGCKEEDSFHPIFLRGFTLAKHVRSAYLYIAGVGLFEAYINDERIGDEFLSPYTSSYDDEIQICAYDVKSLLLDENMIEVFLGNGWYKGRFAGGRENIFGDKYGLIAELRLEYEDGSEEVIVTDESWHYKASDIEHSGIYDGEDMNRLLLVDESNNLRSAILLEKNSDLLVDRRSLPIVVKERLAVQEVIKSPKGETILDFGQNSVGWVEFINNYDVGTAITLEFGEVLQDGCFYNANYRTARAKFVYISNGTKETVRPRFTYFGYRYVKVSGVKTELVKEDFTACVLYSNLQRTGFFKCDNEKLNRLYENSLWSQKSNFLDIPTDCPQRDERLGWTGDAMVFAPTASFHMDTRAFYEKYLHDLRLEQIRLDGVIPMFIPNITNGAHTSAVWGDAGTFIPDILYEYYGDKGILAEHYPMMCDWVDYITREDHKREEPHNLYDFGYQFGDWLALDGKGGDDNRGGTEEHFIASIYYYQSIKLVVKAAEILEKNADLMRYIKLANQVKSAIINEYFTPTGRLSIDTQTAYVICLRFEVYVDKDRIIQQFKRRIEKDDYQIKCGFVGAPLICQVLSENGMDDIAYKLLLRESYPGWLYCVNLGATTIWERWNSLLEDGTCSGTEMNSFNHYSYGSVAEFMYTFIGGIKRLEPGFKRIKFEPHINEDLNHVEVIYNSINGKYAITWKKLEGGDIQVHLEVPFACHAVVNLPRYDKGQFDITAGIYDFVYTPVRPFTRSINGDSIIGDIIMNNDAVNIIQSCRELNDMIKNGGDEIKRMKLSKVIELAETVMDLDKSVSEEIYQELALV